MTPKAIIAVLADFPISWIDSSFPKEGWHVPTWLYNLKLIFEKLNLYQVHWITFSKLVTKKKVIKNNGQFFHILPRGSIKISQATFYIYKRLQISQEIDSINPDIVHAWGTEVEYAICASYLKRKKILSVQGILTALEQRTKINSFEKRQIPFEKKALQRFDLLTSESPWGIARIKELVPLAHIEHWEYAPHPSFYEIKRTPSDKPTCLMAGTDTPVKNVDAAIKVFSSPELSHVTVYLAGVNPAHHPGLPPNILALGGIDRNAMQKLLASSWCLLHPSFADSSPNIVKEARIIGLPCIVSSESGGTQYVKENKSGYIVSPHDIQAMIDSIKKVTIDKQTSLDMGTFDQERCRQLLSLDTMMEKIAQIYFNILNSD